MMDDQDDYSEWMIVLVTTTMCPHCKIWEESGGMKKFTDSIPRDLKYLHYVVSPTTGPVGSDDYLRRNALMGLGVPAVIAVKKYKWDFPRKNKLSSSDILQSPGDPRSADGMDKFNQWSNCLADPDGFHGYLIVNTMPTCGHCIQWIKSGGLTNFMKKFSTKKGVCVIHSERFPPNIARNIQFAPSAHFVTASTWSSPQPEMIQLPDPRDMSAVDKAIDKILREGQWENREDFVPPDYDDIPRRGQMLMTKRPTRNPMKRQTLR